MGKDAFLLWLNILPKEKARQKLERVGSVEPSRANLLLIYRRDYRVNILDAFRKDSGHEMNTLFT